MLTIFSIRRPIHIFLQLFLVLYSVNANEYTNFDSIVYFSDGKCADLNMNWMKFFFCFPTNYVTELKQSPITPEDNSTFYLGNPTYFINSSTNTFISVFSAFEKVINELKENENLMEKIAELNVDGSIYTNDDVYSLKELRIKYQNLIHSSSDESFDKWEVDATVEMLCKFHMNFHTIKSLEQNSSLDLTAFQDEQMAILDAIVIWLDFVRLIHPVILYDSLEFTQPNYPQAEHNEMQGANGECRKVVIKCSRLISNTNLSNPLFKKIKRFPLFEHFLTTKDENLFFFNLDEFSIFQKGQVANISQFSTMKCLVLDNNNKFCPIGYLTEYAAFGDLKQLIESGDMLIKIDKYFCEQLFQLAKSIHYLHENNIIHLDIKANNIFVSKNQNNDFSDSTGENSNTSIPDSTSVNSDASGDNSYQLFLGDFGCASQLGRCDHIGKAEDVYRYPLYPQEIFPGVSDYPIGKYSDWYEFGTLLASIGKGFAKYQGNRLFIDLFSQMINGLTYDTPEIRWGWYNVEKFFKELMSVDLLNYVCVPIQFFNDSGILHQIFVKKSDDFMETDKSNEQTGKLNLVTISTVCRNGYSQGYVFYPYLKEIEILLFDSRSMQHPITAKFVVQRPEIYKFTRNYPVRISTELSGFMPKQYRVGDLLIFQPNQLYSLCFWDRFVISHKRNGRSNFKFDALIKVLEEYQSFFPESTKEPILKRI